jgi:hypothetical protein
MSTFRRTIASMSIERTTAAISIRSMTAAIKPTVATNSPRSSRSYG